MTANILAGWLAFLLGIAAGGVPGLFFAGEAWLGGYDSWRRRLLRLAHVAFFGLGFLNVLFALSVGHLGLPAGAPRLAWASLLLLCGLGAMPAVCYLAAWRRGFRHVFFVPVTCVTLGVALFLWEALQP